MKMKNRDIDSWYIPLPKAELEEYFFVLENGKAASVFPNHAPKAYLKIKSQ